MPKAAVGRFGSRDRLKHQVDRGAALDGGHLVGDVGQHARLRRNLITPDQLVNQLEQIDRRANAIGGGINADHRIAATVTQAVEDRGGDAARIVRRMIRLQAHRQTPA